jgi:hypothetical protein
LGLNLGLIGTDHAHDHGYGHDHAFAQEPYSEELVMGINSSLVLVDTLEIGMIRDPGSARNHHTVVAVDVHMVGVETVDVVVEAIVVDVDYTPYSDSEFEPQAKESSEEEQVIRQPHTEPDKAVMIY